MAKHGRRRDRRREERWRGILQKQAGSGVSIRQFCRDHQLKESAFYFWRRELGRRGREQRFDRELAAERPSAAFVAVTVTPEASTPAAGRIEVVLPGGWRVRLAGAVDRTALADVLAAVAEARAARASEGSPSFAKASEGNRC